MGTIISSPLKHFSRMKRAREICGRKVTTMTDRHPFCEAKRRSSRPSPFVVGGSGAKQYRSNSRFGVAQERVSHGSSAPCGFDTTTLGAHPCALSSKPYEYRR